MLCVSDVISTLPDLDASFIVQAELEGHRWAYQGHAHPFSDPYAIPVLNGLLLQLRIICLTTAVSHITCNAMLEQLEGSRPLGDWGDVVQVRTWLHSVHWANTYSVVSCPEPVVALWTLG